MKSRGFVYFVRPSIAFSWLPLQTTCTNRSYFISLQTAISSCKQDIQLVLDKLDNVQEALTPVKTKNNQLIDLSHSPSSVEDKENSTPLKPRPRIKQERLLLSAKRGCPPMTITIPKLEEQVRITAVKNELDSTNTGSPPNHMLALSPSHDSESNISKLTKPTVKSERITPQELDLFDVNKVKQEYTDDDAAEEEDDVKVKIESVEAKSPLVQKLDSIIATAKSMNDKYGGKSPKPTSYQQLVAKSPESTLAEKDEPHELVSEVEPIGREQNTTEDILYEVKTKPYRSPVLGRANEEGTEEVAAKASFTHTGYLPSMVGTLKLYKNKTTGKHRLVQRNVIGTVKLNIGLGKDNFCTLQKITKVVKKLGRSPKEIHYVSFFAIEEEETGWERFVFKVRKESVDDLYNHLLACLTDQASCC